jgi:hypothetical protein
MLSSDFELLIREENCRWIHGTPKKIVIMFIMLTSSIPSIPSLAMSAIL